MKFIRDIISEKRAQASSAQGADADFADQSTYVLTPDRAVEPEAFVAPKRAQDNAYSMVEDDEPESIFDSGAARSDLADILTDADRDAPEADAYDLDFDDIEADLDGDDDDWDDDTEAGMDAVDLADEAPVEEDNIFSEEMSVEAAEEDPDLSEAMQSGWTGDMPQMGAEDAAEEEAQDDEVAPVEAAAPVETEETRDAADVVSELISAIDPADMDDEDMDDAVADAMPDAMDLDAEIELAQEAPATSVAGLAAALPPMPQTRRVEPAAEKMPDMPVDVPAPAVGRANRRAGRVKTRLLGFNNAQGGADPFAVQETADAQQYTEFPVGWIIVVDGPGRGSAFTIYNGVAQIGRGEGQSVRLDFGDNSISRENHAAIAYDPEQRKFYLGHGGKANLVRLNNRPVLSTEELQNGNLIRIGETTIRFVALCGPDFDWSAKEQDGLKHASFG